MKDFKPSALTPPNQEQKASEILEALDAKDRIRARRRAPNLLLTLTPLWLWCLGLLYLPVGMPVFAKALFHATCWASFLWFARLTWLAQRDSKIIAEDASRQKRRSDFEEAVRRRRSKDQGDSGMKSNTSDSRS